MEQGKDVELAGDVEQEKDVEPSGDVEQGSDVELAGDVAQGKDVDEYTASRASSISVGSIASVRSALPFFRGASV